MASMAYRLDLFVDFQVLVILNCLISSKLDTISVGTAMVKIARASPVIAKVKNNEAANRNCTAVLLGCFVSP